MAYSILKERINKTMDKRKIWQIESEKERYGDLLEKAMKKQEEKEKSMLDALNGVIDWGKQTSQERDEEWEHRKAYTDDLMARAKQRLNKDYKI